MGYMSLPKYCCFFFNPIFAWSQKSIIPFKNIANTYCNTFLNIKIYRNTKITLNS